MIGRPESKVTSRSTGALAPARLGANNSSSVDPYNPFAIKTRDPAEYLAALGQFRFEKLRRQISYTPTH